MGRRRKIVLSVREEPPRYPLPFQEARLVLSDLLQERGAPYVPCAGIAWNAKGLFVWPLMHVKIDEQVEELCRQAHLEFELECAKKWTVIRHVLVPSPNGVDP